MYAVSCDPPNCFIMAPGAMAVTFPSLKSNQLVRSAWLVTSGVSESYATFLASSCFCRSSRSARRFYFDLYLAVSFDSSAPGSSYLGSSAGYCDGAGMGFAAACYRISASSSGGRSSLNWSNSANVSFSGTTFFGSSSSLSTYSLNTVSLGSHVPYFYKSWIYAW